MLIRRLIVIICLLVIGICVHAQDKTVLSGVVRDTAGKPLDFVLVFEELSGKSVYTNVKGYYMLNVPPGQQLSLVYYLQGYPVVRRSVSIKEGDTHSMDVILKGSNILLKDAVVREKRRIRDASIVDLPMKVVNFNPGPNGGIEGLIQMAVGTHNELSSQYNVRGGNYDENLVYVNDFQIYRPFLVRSGQQEGLSFINSDLVSNVNFSVGGFQAKYGDKMSSVLDVTYKRPTAFASSVTLSLLGASMHMEGSSKNNKLTYLIGARQKSNQYILQAQPTKGVYNPSFTDLQALIDYRINSKWEIEAIGNYARNRFSFFPETMTSSFGVLNQAYQLNVFYNGSEFDQFDSRFGGLSATYQRSPESRFKMKFLASAFQTNEYETYDITGQYLFGELQTDQSKANFGQIKTYLGAGGIQDYARNYLDVNVGDVGFRGTYESGNKKNLIQFGANGTVTNITDNLHQWENRDSAGFSQPYDPNNLTMAYFYHSSSSFNYTRINGFIQDNISFDTLGKLSGTFGARFNYSGLNSEFLVSPRVQLLYKPGGEKDSLILKLSAGFYAQPPFYREMRDLSGGVNSQLKAQQSFQAVAGAEYNYKWNKRPFKVTGEAYYKNLWNLDPYIYDNVRIRYTGKNDAIGYVYGAEVRLYGDLVKDATSWISIGWMKGMQKITDSGSISGYNNYFALPSDQRFMLGGYFEDYLPHNKNFKVHLNMMYATGLPVGPPNASLYKNILRLPDYKRVDIGFSTLLLDETRHNRPANSFFNHVKSIWASLEVFNLLGIQNTLSYTWIQDWTSQKTYAVPNRLTSRLLNLKLLFNF